MYIISDFHDYYDTATAYGIDKQTIYNRKVKILDFDKIKTPYSEELTAKHNGVFYDYLILKGFLGFCGKVYPFIYVRKTQQNSNLNEVNVYYSADGILNFLRQENIGLDRTKYRYYYYKDMSIHSEKGIKTFFETSTSEFEPLFQQHRCPVFLIGKGFKNELGYENGSNNKALLILNPKLLPLKFPQLKDAVSSFQDIYMYLSGVLGNPEKPMIEIADKYKQAAKGHDSPYSFRKPPGGKPWR